MHARIVTLYLLFSLATALTAQQSVPLDEGTMLGLYFLAPDAVAEGRDTKDAVDGRVHHLRGERGTHEGRDVMLWISPDTTARDGWPLDRDLSYDHELTTEYVIINAGEPADRHWLQQGVIFGLHDLRLKEDVNRAEFERFIHTMWAPTRSDALPDSKIVFLKGIGGKQNGEYAYVWLIDSEDTRDYYFPAAETSSQVYQDFEKGWSWLNDDKHIGKYLAGSEGELFTDFLVRW